MGDEIKDALKDVFGEKAVDEVFSREDVINILRGGKSNVDTVKKLFDKYCDTDFTPTVKIKGDLALDIILKFTVLIHMHRHFRDEKERAISIANTVTYIVDLFLNVGLIRNFKHNDRLLIIAIVAYLLQSGWEHYRALAEEVHRQYFTPRANQKINYDILNELLKEETDDTVDPETEKGD
jgi:hypothetical protein